VRLSIRWRLTLWNTLAFAALLACFAGLVYALLRGALLAQLDRSLESALGQLANDPRAAAAPEARLRYWIEEYKDHLGLWCAVYANGALHSRSAGMAERDVPPLPADLTGVWVSNEDLPGLGRQRVMARRMQVGGLEYTVVLMAPLAAADAELAQVRAVLLTAGPAALLLAAALAYALACKALAPVEALRRSADAVTAERLDRRLSAANPDDELGRLTHTINAMIARLERSFAEVRRFTADASHELRTPLTVLRSEVEVALGKDLTAAEHRRLLGGLLEELGRMSRLTDQLLTLSRRDAGVEHFATAPLDLCALVAGVAEALGPLAESRRVRLEWDAAGPAVVAGDGALLRLVFINLVDNALKYTPEGGEVRVRVEERDGASVVTVGDTGIGIPPEHLPHVFDRFYRVDKARSRAEGGTGLGLSIAQSIVKAHGGTITIHSPAGRGTVCTVTLPRASTAGKINTN
jgi:heavy metal sensor kinase